MYANGVVPVLLGVWFMSYVERFAVGLKTKNKNVRGVAFSGTISALVGVTAGAMIINDEENTEEVRFQALHHQFVASALAVKLGHEINQEFKIGCMIAYMCGYPSTCNPMHILKAQQHDQMKNMLCGDVQVRGYYLGFAKRYFEENNIKVVVKDNDAEILKNGMLKRIKKKSFYWYKQIIEQNGVI